MEIKWMTKEEVQYWAERGVRTAVCSSYAHWIQLYHADKEQLKWALVEGKTSCRAAHCSLCELYNQGVYGCTDCPLFQEFEVTCSGSDVWRQCRDLLCNLEYQDLSVREWELWKKACSSMLSVLLGAAFRVGVSHEWLKLIRSSLEMREPDESKGVSPKWLKLIRSGLEMREPDESKGFQQDAAGDIDKSVPSQT